MLFSMALRTSLAFSIVIGCAMAASGASPEPAGPAASAVPGASAMRMSFVPHAALFSLATRQPVLVDPDVFVLSQPGKAGLGLAQIAHVAGERNAEMRDDPTAAAVDANARPLGFDVQHWFAANGVAEFGAPDATAGGMQTIVVRFANLVPHGRYSLFIAHFEARTVTYVPLDGTGKTNSFTATAAGAGGATVSTLQALPHGSAILVVYHGDRRDHGFSQGNVGFDAFDQLVLRIP